MGDISGIQRDKRHKSSCSLAERLEEKESQRKFNMRDTPAQPVKQASIPEVEDRFILSDSRCEDFRAKLDMIHNLKKKRKLKRRSITRVSAPAAIEENLQPLISIQTQRKTKTSRPRPVEEVNYNKAYLDPATAEQHRMIRAYNQSRLLYTSVQQSKTDNNLPSRTRTSPRKDRQETRPRIQSEFLSDYHVYDENFVPRKEDADVFGNVKYRKRSKSKLNKKDMKTYRKATQNLDNIIEPRNNRHNHIGHRRRCGSAEWTSENQREQVVELYNKKFEYGVHTQHENAPVTTYASCHAVNTVAQTVETEGDDSDREEKINRLKPRKKARSRNNYERKWQNRSYELPTFASQMKNYNFRYLSSNYSNIPFIVSKSTEPSHNIGVNIQQVLSGLKMQQPVSRIPFTIAHRMGLRHIPVPNGSKFNLTFKPSNDAKDLNVLNLGSRYLHLPTYKCMSFNRLLRLYQENDGIVSRFLRSLGRPNYYYNLPPAYSITPDGDGATSKGQSGCQEARQHLEEYSRLYREYERVEKCLLKTGSDEELEKRKEELTRELAARERHISKVVQEFKLSVDQPQLHATTSTMVGETR